MSTRTKNPVHPSALSVSDLHVGRRILLVSNRYGVRHEGRIARAPYVERMRFGQLDEPDPRRLMIKIITEHGRPMLLQLSNVGVIPTHGSNLDNGGWSAQSFIIDVRKRNLLPESLRNAATWPVASFSAYQSFIEGDFTDEEDDDEDFDYDEL